MAPSQLPERQTLCVHHLRRRQRPEARGYPGTSGSSYIFALTR